MLLQEMKKIWRPGILLVLLLLGTAYYTMYLEGPIVYNLGENLATGELPVAEQWVVEYGTTISPEEMVEIESTRPALELEADAWIAQNPIAQTYGLTNYADFQRFLNEYYYTASGELKDEAWDRYADANQMLNYLYGEETGNIAGRLYTVNLYTEFYAVRQQYGPKVSTAEYDRGYTEREWSHILETFFGPDEAWQNLLPAEVPGATSIFFAYLLVWMVLSVGLFLSPVLVRDKMRGMESLQYASRRGRGLAKTQFTAAMLSAVILTTVNLLIFGGMFLRNGTIAFADCRMYSFTMTGFCWPNWTYGTWCIVLTLMCYAVTLGFGAMAWFLAGTSNNYIAMLLKLIPLFVCAAIVLQKTMTDAFYFSNSLYRSFRVPYIEGVVTIAVLLIGLSLYITGYRRIKRKDLFVS